MNTLLLLLLFILILLVTCSTRVSAPKGSHLKTDKIIMYGKDSCGYTVKMKKIIDESQYKDLFEYIEVSEKPQILKELNIEGVPAFKYKEKVVVGAMPVKDLLKKINI